MSKTQITNNNNDDNDLIFSSPSNKTTIPNHLNII